MSYQAEKAALRRKERHVNIVIGCVLVVALIGLIVFSAFYPPSVWKYYVSLPYTTKRAEGECRVHFLNVGQGDSVLIELPDNKTMLVDGGDRDSEHTTYILRYINALGIDALDYIVATHPDTDHTGGLAKIVEVKGAQTVYIPHVDEGVNEAFSSFLAAAEEAECQTVISERGISLSVSTGEFPYTLEFLSPHAADNPSGEYVAAGGADASSDAINDTSSVIWLDYFGCSALLCGDITAQKERDLLEEANAGLLTVGDRAFSFGGTEILKVAHHGSKYSSSLEFLQALGVRDAIVSVGADNTYSHPSKEACERLEAVGAEIWRTDTEGTVVVTMRTDGTYVIRSYGI